MCITDEKLVDSYCKGDSLERFMLIYRNYVVFPQLIDCSDPSSGCISSGKGFSATHQNHRSCPEETKYESQN